MIFNFSDLVQTVCTYMYYTFFFCTACVKSPSGHILPFLSLLYRKLSRRNLLGHIADLFKNIRFV